jgi:hypothetical protein
MRWAGIVQVSASRDISYEQAAFFIAQHVGASAEQVKGIETDHPVRHSTLDATAIQDRLGLSIPDVTSTIITAGGLTVAASPTHV